MPQAVRQEIKEPINVSITVDLQNILLRIIIKQPQT